MPLLDVRRALYTMVLLCLCWTPTAHALAGERQVLVLYSLGGNSASLWQGRVNKGMYEEVAREAGPSVPAIYEERFDTMRLGEVESSAGMEPYLRTKYAKIKFDAIVSENYLAGRFLSEHPGLFPGVPRYYVNHGRRGWRPADGIGLEIEVDYARALATIPQVMPDVQRIVIVGDRSPRVQEWVDGMRALIPSYRGRIEIEIWDNQSFAQLYQRAAALGPHTAIFLFATYGDNTGAKGVPAAIARSLAMHAKVPIFTHVDSLIVPGIVGGYVMRGEAVGQTIGRIAAGKPADVGHAQDDVFDDETAQRFHLRPIKGVQWRNKSQDVWKQYRWQIIASMSLMALEGVLITTLVLALRGRRQGVRALHEERHKLEERVAMRTRELQIANTALEALATTDPLTGIGNRRKMTEQINAEIERARRFHHPLALLMIDIDHFKRINDSHGHNMGDCAIVAVATALTTEMRTIDLAARFGGEEFVVLMPETGLDVAASAAERLRVAIAALAIESGDGQTVRLTISIGVAASDPQVSSDTPSSLLSRADRAVYRAKAEGRDRVACG